MTATRRPTARSAARNSTRAAFPAEPRPVPVPPTAAELTQEWMAEFWNALANCQSRAEEQNAEFNRIAAASPIRAMEWNGEYVAKAEGRVRMWKEFVERDLYIEMAEAHLDFVTFPIIAKAMTNYARCQVQEFVKYSNWRANSSSMFANAVKQSGFEGWGEAMGQMMDMARRADRIAVVAAKEQAAQAAAAAALMGGDILEVL